ncbi:MAG TPA: hypothetical protein VGC68_11570 [Enterovirga sp.]
MFARKQLFASQRRRMQMGLAAVLACGSFSAIAQERSPDSYPEIESKYLFGFTTGTDIGLEGEKEVSVETNGRFGKRGGDYRSFDHKLEFEFTPTQFMQFELGVLGASHRIRDVPGLDDRNSTSFAGLSGEFRYLLIGRGPGSPFGLTFSVEPEWARIDDTTGERVRKFETELKLSADTEIVPNRVYAAVNALYEPEWVRAYGERLDRESKVGLSTAVAFRLTPETAIGAELGYFRAYEGLGLRKFEGQALYVGPTLYLQLTKKTFVQAAWSSQVAGHSQDEPGRALDLDHFERHRAKLKLGIEF